MTWSDDGFQGRVNSFGADEAKQIYFVRTKFLIASEPGPWKTGWRRQKLATKLCASWPGAWLPSHTALIKALPPLSHASVMEAGCLLLPASFLFFYVKLNDFTANAPFHDSRELKQPAFKQLFLTIVPSHQLYADVSIGTGLTPALFSRLWIWEYEKKIAELRFLLSRLR